MYGITHYIIGQEQKVVTSYSRILPLLRGTDVLEFATLPIYPFVVVFVFQMNIFKFLLSVHPGQKKW